MLGLDSAVAMGKILSTAGSALKSVGKDIAAGTGKVWESISELRPTIEKFEQKAQPLNSFLASAFKTIESGTTQAVDAVHEMMKGIFKGLQEVRERVSQLFGGIDQRKLPPQFQKAAAVQVFIQSKAPTPAKLGFLAALYDPKCIEKDGKLNIERTKSVIKYALNQGSVSEQALKQLVFEGDAKALQSVKFQGQTIEVEAAAQQVAKLYGEAAKRQPCALKTDIALTVDNKEPIPTKTVMHKPSEIKLGDMHGNSKLALHQLVNSGLLQIRQGCEGEWGALMQMLEEADKGEVTDNGKTAIQEFGQKLSSILEAGDNCDTKLTLIGDLLNDRGQNDFCMLEIFKLLDKEQIPFDIVFSNHDQGFLEFCRRLQVGETPKDIIRAMDRQGIVSSYDSLQSLASTLNADNTQQFLDLVKDHYLSHLKVFSLSEDGRVLSSHAPVNNMIINDLVRCTGRSPDNMCLAEKVAHINHWFAEGVKDLDTFSATYLSESSGGSREKVHEGALIAALWRRGANESAGENAIDIDHGGNPQSGRYNVDIRAPDDVINVHGHTENLYSHWPVVDTLSTFFNKEENQRLIDSEPTLESFRENIFTQKLPDNDSRSPVFLAQLLVLNTMEVYKLDMPDSAELVLQQVKTKWKGLSEEEAYHVERASKEIVDRHKHNKEGIQQIQQDTVKKLQGLLQTYQNVRAKYTLSDGQRPPLYSLDGNQGKRGARSGRKATPYFTEADRMAFFV